MNQYNGDFTMSFSDTLMITGLLLALLLSAVPVAAATNPSEEYLYSWGNDASNQSYYPDVQNPVAISAGAFHSLVLLANGSVVAWGDNTYGQTDVPTESDFTAISAGGYHNIALHSNGSLAAWGRNNLNQTDVPVGSDFTAITSGTWHSIALRENHTLAAWGNNDYGQTDVPDGNDFIAVSAGGCHSLALRSNGSIVAWGQTSRHLGEIPPGNDFVAISAGWYHNLALRSNGSAVIWGSGRGSLPGNNYTAISAGGYHGILLENDGVASAYGWNQYDQTGEIHGVNVRMVAAGYSHTIILYEPLPATTSMMHATVLHAATGSLDYSEAPVISSSLEIQDDVSPMIIVDAPLSPGYRIFGYDVPMGGTISHSHKEGITRVYGPDNKQVFWAHD